MFLRAPAEVHNCQNATQISVPTKTSFHSYRYACCHMQYWHEPCAVCCPASTLEGLYCAARAQASTALAQMDKQKETY